MMRSAPTEIVRTGLPYEGDVEIRVHGVSGTPPEELLDRATTERVAGDRIAGFYRPADSELARDVPVGTRPGTPAADHGPWLEGYSWGGWTSGAKTRALWLMLAPFALLNVAPRMLPPDPETSSVTTDAAPTGATRHPVAEVAAGASRRPAPLRLLTAALIRVLAATLTVTFVLGVTAPMLTTVARRCPTAPGQESVCHGIPRFLLNLLGALTPAGQLALMTIVPAVLVLLLGLLSRSSARRYSTRSAAAPYLPGRPDDAAVPLLRPDLWNGGVASRRLRMLHVQIAVLTIIGVLVVLFPGSGLRTTAVGVCAVTILTAVLLTGLRLPTGRGEPAVSRLPRSLMLIWGGVIVSGGLAVALVVAGPSVGATAAGLDPDHLVRTADSLVRWLFEIQVGLLALIVLALTASLLRGAGRGRSMFMAGYAGFFIAFLGWLLGSMMAASVLIIVPVWVGTDGFSFTPGWITQVLQQHSTWFGDTTRSSGFGMLVGIGALLVLVLQLAARAYFAMRAGGSAADRATVRADYDAVPDRAGLDGARRDFTEPDAAARAKEIGFQLWIAHRVDRVPRGMAVFCLVIAAVLLLQGAALTFFPAANNSFWQFTLGRGIGGAQVIAWGVYLTGALLVGLLALGVLAYRTPGIRRGVGVLWDLACFWPRDGHPFAPPCYNERIMPEVRTRIAYYVGGIVGSTDAPTVAPPRGRVVLAGHSQGTVIALAAVLIQPEQVRERISLMTFGCVLDRLYSRFFPRYFSAEVYALAASMLSTAGTVRWTNLWRRTDYLGGAVPYPFAGPTSGLPSDELPTGPRQVRCVDPMFDRAAGDVVFPTAGRHSGFWLDPVFQQQVCDLMADMLPLQVDPDESMAPSGPTPAGRIRGLAGRPPIVGPAP